MSVCEKCGQPDCEWCDYYPERVEEPGLLSISMFRSLVDPTVCHAPDMRWSDLVDWLSSPRAVGPADGLPGWTAKHKDPRKASLPLWSPVQYHRGCSRRGKAGVQWVFCLGLDYDDGTSLEEALDVWGGVEGVWHTTWGHTKEKPRWRGVLPLARPASEEVWPQVFDWAQSRAGGHLDPATRDCSRAWYAPAQGPGGPFVVRRTRGERLVVPAELYYPRSRRPPQPRAARRMSRPVVSEGKAAKRAAADRLKVDPAARAQAGRWLQGRVGGGSVRGVRCPDCGRKSMWWPLEPTGPVKAMCSHRNSCGAQVFLDVLLDGGAV